MTLLKIMKILATVFTVIGLAIGAYAQSFLTNGLVAYYPFSGNANDASGNGNNGTVNGATLAPDRFGIPNAAYYFAGDGSYISVPDSPSLDITNGLTLSAWINVQPGGLYQPRILHKHVFDLGLSDTSGSPTVGAAIQNYPSGGALVGAGPISSGQWMLINVTYDLQMLTLYFNGALVSQVQATVPLDTNSLAIAIGRNTESGTDWFQGYIDELRIYNRALSASEIQQLYIYEAPPLLNLVRAVKPSFANLRLGTNYQLQVSSDLNTWSNYGSAFTATNSSLLYPQYFNVGDFGQYFFRLQVMP